jgi:uncharacterized protein (TIGR02118 family)
MLKVMTLFLKRPDMTRQQFRDYYEDHHVAMGLAANKHFGFVKYVRNHTVGAHTTPPAQPFLEFDCFSEYTFPDVAKAVEAQKFMLTEEGKALAQDELNFLDMSYHPSFAVDESLIAGAPRGVDVGLMRKLGLVLARGKGVPAAKFLESVDTFAREFARRHPKSFVRLVRDAAIETPAGRPPFDALLTLWPKNDAPDLQTDWRWPIATDSALALDIETLEAATETLGL